MSYKFYDIRNDSDFMVVHSFGEDEYHFTPHQLTTVRADIGAEDMALQLTPQLVWVVDGVDMKPKTEANKVATPKVQAAQTKSTKLPDLVSKK